MKIAKRDLIHDPYTRACAGITPLFSEFLMEKVMNGRTAPGFPPAVQELYAYAVMELEDSLNDYSAYVSLIPEAVKSLRTAPSYCEDIEALERLKHSTDALLSELKFYHDSMNWRKIFVQRHFTALLGDLSTLVTTAPQPHAPGIHAIVVSLGGIRDEIFRSSSTTLIEEYLELAAAVRSQDSFMLRRIQLEREERRTPTPLSVLEELENDILVRVLFEDATGSEDGR